MRFGWRCSHQCFLFFSLFLSSLSLVSFSSRSRLVSQVKAVVRVAKPGLISPSGKTDARVRAARAEQRALETQRAQRRRAEEQRARDERRRGALPAGTFFVTRSLFLRGLAAVYLTAFLVAHHQNPALIGDGGLTPARALFQRANASFAKIHGEEHSPYTVATMLRRFSEMPSLLWFLPGVGGAGGVFAALQAIALAGSVLSGVVLVSGRGNMPILSALWLGYFTIEGVGGTWYSFGWESQLLETGFLAIFAVPFLSLARGTPSSGGWAVVWGYRWLIFRIMLGAGLIKLRGDECWRDLTCMDYHYETQPVPGPLSSWFHHNPKWFHAVETGTNHFVEVVVPFFMLLGRPWMIASGLIQIGFQLVLIASGNLSFLNWLTLLPSIWCFDDRFLVWLWGGGGSAREMVEDAVVAAAAAAPGDGHGGGEQKENTDKNKNEGRGGGSGGGLTRMLRAATSVSLFVVIAYLSKPVVINLLALEGQQAMNTNFSPFKIVNTYGAFGSITKKRTEIILEGTRGSIADVMGENGAQAQAAVVWTPYEFKCKPGDVNRRPCWITPYHYRLDWLMWFAAFGNYQQHPWLLHLTTKLLAGDHVASALLAHDPFLSTGSGPPTFIRAEHYVYALSPPNDQSVWTRERIGEYFPPVHLGNPSLQQFVAKHGWTWDYETGGPASEKVEVEDVEEEEVVVEEEVGVNGDVAVEESKEK